MDDVVHLLRRGGVIAYPTETVYGIGGDAADETVLERIRRMKERDVHHPFLILVARSDDVFAYAKRVSSDARMLMERFWPGPLTLVFDALPGLPKSLTAESDKIGIRVSPDPICAALMDRYQGALVSTSANRAGETPARSSLEVMHNFGEELDLILDGGARESGIPSTVLDVSEDSPRLIREGAIGRAEIESIVGDVHGE